MLSQIDLIIVPIGSALFTSIIGWAVAAEFERGIYGKSEKTVVDFALDDLANEIKFLAKELSKSSDIWKHSIDNTIQNIEKSTYDINTKYEKLIIDSSNILFDQMDMHIQSTQKKLDTSNAASQKIIDSYLDTFNQLNENMQTQMQAIQNTFETSSDEAEKAVNSLVTSFRELAIQMNEHTKAIEEDFLNSTNTAKGTIVSLAKSYNNLQIQIEQNINNIEANLKTSSIKADQSVLKFMSTFEELFTHLEQYSDTMKVNFKQSSENAENLINQLGGSFSKVFLQIDSVTTQWDEHIRNMKNFSRDSDASLKNLLDDSKIVAKELKEVVEGVPPASKILREIDDILLVISSINEKNI